MLVVVSYDIVDDKKRTKLAGVLEDYGTRVQYSVFECELNKSQLDQMIKEALEYVNLKEDSLRIYYLCEGCLTKITSFGQKRGYEEREAVIV